MAKNYLAKNYLVKNMQWLPDDIDLTDYMQRQEMKHKVRRAADFEDLVIDYLTNDPTVTGERLPWRKAENMLRFRSGEVTLWTGINGHGKSLVLGQVVTGLVNQGASVCIASLEMQPRATLGKMIQQAKGDGQRCGAYAKRYLHWSGDKLWLYDHIGDCKSDRMLAIVRYCADKLHINHMVIDSLMKCGVRQDDYDAQAEFVSALCDAGRDTGIHIHLVAHSKKQIDESRKPGKMDIKGSGTIGDLVHNVVTVWRNKPKEQAIERGDYSMESEPDQILICDKQRNGDWEGQIGLWYHAASRQYTGARDGCAFDLMRTLP